LFRRDGGTSTPSTRFASEDPRSLLLLFVALVVSFYFILILKRMATPSPASGPGDLATFNILHGYPEALVRGMRSSFLLDADYHHLTQCESLDDARLNLSETDYHDALADESSMTPASMQKLAIEKVRRSLAHTDKLRERLQRMNR
jgi:ATP synthase (C/AC39) subunit